MDFIAVLFTRVKIEYPNLLLWCTWGSQIQVKIVGSVKLRVSL